MLISADVAKNNSNIKKKRSTKNEAHNLNEFES